MRPPVERFLTLKKGRRAPFTSVSDLKNTLNAHRSDYGDPLFVWVIDSRGTYHFLIVIEPRDVPPKEEMHDYLVWLESQAQALTQDHP